MKIDKIRVFDGSKVSLKDLHEYCNCASSLDEWLNSKNFTIKLFIHRYCECLEEAIWIDFDTDEMMINPKLAVELISKFSYYNAVLLNSRILKAQLNASCLTEENLIGISS